MPGQLTTLTVVEPGVALLQMCDETGKNALSRPMVEELESRFLELAHLKDLKVVIVAGLEEVFSSGADREMLSELIQGAVAPRELLLPRAFLDVPVPTIAAMEGHAVGGGLALGLCADLILLARESRYGTTFMDLGFTPGMGATRLLENVLTRAVAHEMLFTGQTFRGSHFDGRGGFNYVLPRRDVLPKALDLARRMAEKPKASLVALKTVLSRRKRVMFESSRTDEILMHELVFRQPEVIQHLRESIPESHGSSSREDSTARADKAAESPPGDGETAQ